MTAFIIYLLKANLLLTILFIFYFFLCRNEKFFRLNRFFLLGTLLLSMLLPLIPDADPFLQGRPSGSAGLPNLIDLYNQIQLTPAPFTTRAVLPPKPVALTKGWSLLQILLGVYGLISSVLLLRLLFRVLRVMVFIKSSPRKSKDGIIYCATEREVPPFSFFNYLVLNKSQHSSKEIRQIILHEKAHIRQGHTLDLLFAEGVSAVLWINPLARSLRRQLKLNLEYIADEHVLGTGVDKKHYQLSILQNSLKSMKTYPLTNLFNSSKLKSRIKMMNTKTTSNSHLYKYLFVLPLIAATYSFVAPLNVESLQVNTQKLHAERQAQKLKAFEGYYKFVFPDHKEPSYIKITAKDTTLVLTQIWDDQEITFQQTGPLEFFCAEKNFPLKFSKDSKGIITQVLAFNRDLWNRTEDYKPPVAKTAIQLRPEQLKAFEGVYGMTEGGETNYIQFTATATGLVLKQQWDGKEIAFSPETELNFFCKRSDFTLKFTKNDAGAITQVLAFDKDLWVRKNQ